MSITYTLRRRDSRSLTTTGSGVTFNVATGTRGPNSVSDATALGTLTDAVADALALIASNAAGTAARKVAITSIVRAILQATDAAGVRTAIGLGTVATLSYPGGTTLYLRADGTWAAAGGGTVTSTDITDSTVVGRAVLTAADAAAARSAIGAGTGSGDALTSGTLGQFAATTSAQLAGVLTDETGSGAAVFGTAPTLAAPVLTGTVVVRQTGGTPGTDEATHTHTGSRYEIRSYDGEVRLIGTRTVCAQHSNTSLGSIIECGKTLVRTSISGNSACEIDPAFGLSLSSAMPILWSSGADAGTAFDTRIRRSSASTLDLDNGTNGAFAGLRLGTLTASGTITLGTYTVATLPSAASNTGAMARVSDSSVAASGNYGATVAGGGANVVKVFSNGSNWIIA